jgi:hypothetical protein
MKVVSLAVSGNNGVVDVVRGIDTETLAGKGLPQETAVCAVVAVHIGLKPSVARRQAASRA